MGGNLAVKVRYALGSRKRRTYGPKPNGKGVRGNSVPDARWNLKEWMREHPKGKVLNPPPRTGERVLNRNRI
jgi:hypothetical protein